MDKLKGRLVDIGERGTTEDARDGPSAGRLVEPWMYPPVYAHGEGASP